MDLELDTQCTKLHWFSYSYTVYQVSLACLHKVPNSTGSVISTVSVWSSHPEYQTLLAPSFQSHQFSPATQSIKLLAPSFKSHQFGPVTQTTKLCWLCHSNPINLAQSHKIPNCLHVAVGLPLWPVLLDSLW